MKIADDTYREWIARHDTPSAADLDALERSLDAQPRLPSFDVVMPVHDPPEAFLEGALASVLGQRYPAFRLCIVDDGSTRPDVHLRLAEVARDPRVRFARLPQNRGIAAAVNAAIALGESDFVTFVNHDDVVPPHALGAVARELLHNPDTNVLYSDFDFLDAEGRRTNPFFKPDYNPALHLGLNLPSLLTVYRRTLLERVGGMRAEYPGSEDYDLSLRAAFAAPPGTVRHVAHVLYHWRIVGTSSSHARTALAVDSARRAVREHCERTGVPSTVDGTPRSMLWNRVRPVAEPPLTVVADEPGEHGLAETRNRALRDAGTELVAFVDPRLAPRDASWLRETASLFADPSTAVVGARVLGPDGRVEHGGLVVRGGAEPRALSAFHGMTDADADYFGRAELVHRVSAVSGGVIVVRRSALLAAGGFDASLPTVLALDVDACLRARASGHAVLLCPHAVFVAREPAPRAGTDLPPRFAEHLGADPYYNPNVSPAADYRLACPPAHGPAWAPPGPVNPK